MPIVRGILRGFLRGIERHGAQTYRARRPLQISSFPRAKIGWFLLGANLGSSCWGLWPGPLALFGMHTSAQTLTPPILATSS